MWFRETIWRWVEKSLVDGWQIADDRLSGKHQIRRDLSSSCAGIRDSSECCLLSAVLRVANVKGDENASLGDSIPGLAPRVPIAQARLTCSEDRVRGGAAKLAKMLSAKQQGRLDGFFTVKPKEGGSAGAGAKKDDKKRKGDEKGGAKKKGKK